MPVPRTGECVKMTTFVAERSLLHRLGAWIVSYGGGGRNRRAGRAGSGATGSPDLPKRKLFVIMQLLASASGRDAGSKGREGMTRGPERYAMPWGSLLLAPFASVPALVVTGLGSSDAGMASDLGSGLVFGFLLGVPVSFIGIAVVGLPLYFLLQRFDSLRSWIACSIGALVPFLVLFDEAPLRTTVGGTITGLAVGAFAYALRPRGVPASGQ